jgi:hypothetical protein
MSTFRSSALALALLGSGALLTNPSFAVEPDVDSPAGPQLPSPRDHPDFQADDQAGVTKLVPVPPVELGEGPVIVVPERAEPLPPPPDPEP